MYLVLLQRNLLRCTVTRT